MNIYIYQDDLFCEDCAFGIQQSLKYGGREPRLGKKLKKLIKKESDHYPQGPYDSLKMETDKPYHCGKIYNCLNAIEFNKGQEYKACYHKIGCLLETRLTPDGVKYIMELKLENRESFILPLWLEYFGKTYPELLLGV